MSVLRCVLSVWAALLTAGLWVCLAATRRHFRARGAAGDAPWPAMTVIKPVRGWDAALEEGLEALAAEGAGGRLQLIVALESADDPAHAAALALARSRPGRDIEVVVTGPAGTRMGKIHNMIEALPRAKHPFVVFSDADAVAGPALVAATGRAFAGGAEAVYALPVHAPSGGLAALLHRLAFSHFFGLPAAFSARVLGYPLCAGAWMGFTRELLERMGGLEPFGHAIADDFSLSRKAWSLGARSRQLDETVLIRESGESAAEAVEHLAKWAAIIRWCVPVLFAAAPLASPVLVALAAWGLGPGGGALPAAAILSRAAVAALQDRAMGVPSLPWLGYALLPAADLAGFLFWLSGLRSSIRWRGTRYRLSSGGQAEVLGLRT